MVINPEPALSMIPEVLFLVEQICPRTAQIDNLGAPVPVLLQPCTFEAVESVRDTLATANDALVLVVAEGAFVADADEGCRSDVGVADWAFAIAFIAEAAHSYAGLLAAHYEIAGEMLAMRV